MPDGAYTRTTGELCCKIKTLVTGNKMALVHLEPDALVESCVMYTCLGTTDFTK